MNKMYAMLLFLVFITSMSSPLCVSSDNDGKQEISMVVEDQKTLHHDAGIGNSKANPVVAEILILEDGKELILARKSSPGKNCISLGQPCGALDHCCDPYYCTGFIAGKCQKEFCRRTGLPCGPEPCCGVCVAGYCVG